MARHYDGRTELSADRFLSADIIDTSVSLCVFGIGDKFAEVKAKLLPLYGGEWPVNADGKALELKDVQKADEMIMPALPDFAKPRYNVLDVKRIMRRLMRVPGGCPWDSVQTHESIRINMIEEAYEAVDAVDKRDIPNMIEEFGDVLLQSVLQSEIARRDGEFDFEEVCDGLCKKLISRHSFIFGEDSASDPNAAIKLWEKNKAVEKKYASLKDKLMSMPEGFPSLLLAEKTHKKTKNTPAATDAKAAYDDAISRGDLVAVIAAAAALLADEGKDAEAELNKYVKAKIAEL